MFRFVFTLDKVAPNGRLPDQATRVTLSGVTTPGHVAERGNEGELSSVATLERCLLRLRWEGVDVVCSDDACQGISARSGARKEVATPGNDLGAVA